MNFSMIKKKTRNSISNKNLIVFLTNKNFLINRNQKISQKSTKIIMMPFKLINKIQKRKLYTKLNKIMCLNKSIKIFINKITQKS